MFSVATPFFVLRDSGGFFEKRTQFFRLRFARLVTHYWSNHAFLEDHHLVDGARRLGDIPAVLLHGRYDVSGPLETALRVHRAWPGSRLQVVDDAGHGGGSFDAALRAAIAEMTGGA